MGSGTYRGRQCVYVGGPGCIVGGRSCSMCLDKVDEPVGRWVVWCHRCVTLQVAMYHLRQLLTQLHTTTGTHTQHSESSHQTTTDRQLEKSMTHLDMTCVFCGKRRLQLVDTSGFCLPVLSTTALDCCPVHSDYATQNWWRSTNCKDFTVKFTWL